MKHVIAALLLATVGTVANATIAHDSDVVCSEFKAKVKRNGWAEMYIGNAGVNHPTTFVKANSDCFDKEQRAYLEPVQVGSGTCWLKVCANDQFSADSWARSGWETYLNP